MSPRRLTHVGSLLLVPVLALALVACADDNVEDDPRGALRDAVMALGDWEGTQITLGAQLDETAEASARQDGELSDEELAVLRDSTLVVRGASLGDGEDAESEMELVLTVADEEVLTIRSLPEYRLFALMRLEAMESVADSLGETTAFQEAVDELETMAGMIGIGDVYAAAEQGEWVRITGAEQMASMFGGMAGEPEEQPDEEELEEAGRNIAQRLVGFLDDEGVAVSHVGSDDAGERVRVTMRGDALRELLGDVLTELETVEAMPDASGMGAGMGMDEMRQELEQSIPDDTEVDVDAWIDGGELSQLAVDVFEVARAADEPDVPEGEFLVAIALEEFTGGVEEPETDVTLDLFGVIGNFVGGMMGGLDGGPADGESPFGDPPSEEGTGGTGDEGPGVDDPGTDSCFTEEEAEELLSGVPEDQREVAEQQLNLC